MLVADQRGEDQLASAPPSQAKSRQAPGVSLKNPGDFVPLAHMRDLSLED